jgi:hypothetical protein
MIDLAAPIAKLITAEATDMVASKVFLDYHLAVRTSFEFILSIETASNLSIAFPTMLDL